MSIRKGNVIIAGNIDAVYDTDEQTITINQNEKLEVIGTINKNTLTPKYDWVGTKAEYDALEEKSEDWLYFVTDDEKETVTLANCVGQIIQAVCTSSYIPNGCIPCDGTEYTADRFLEFWTNYLTCQPTKILTCTYNEYNTEITTYGQCAKFAVDTSSQKFKAPTIKDGSVIQQAMSDSELGKAYNAGLPNITGTFNTRRDNTANTLGTSGAFASERYGGSDSFFYGNDNTSNGFKVSIDASRSSAVYGNSSTVQPNAVALRYFVVVVDTYLNQSQLDWTTYTQSLNNKADKNLVNTGLITNCITEIPQDIKLELNNGVLILKAGSVIYIPDGFEEDGTTPKFDVVTVSIDKTLSYTKTASVKELILIRYDQIRLEHWTTTDCFSSTTQPTATYQCWYNTSNNTINASTNGGSTYGVNLSLPICSVSVDSTGITSIDQIFNGFGYIGNTVFVLPDVKGLIPNGKNTDGTLKNLELKTSKVITNTFSSASTAHVYTLFIQEDDSLSKRDDAWKYNESENYNYHSNEQYTNGFIGFNFSAAADGKIASITQKSIFRIIDYSEADFVITYKRPTSANPTWYRLYKSGWVEQGGINKSGTTRPVVQNLLITMADTNYTITHADCRPSGNSNMYVTWFYNKTVNSFTYYFNGGGSGTSADYTLSWEVKGFAAGY